MKGHFDTQKTRDINDKNRIQCLVHWIIKVYLYAENLFNDQVVCHTFITKERHMDAVKQG